jgi:hypothetical protein
VVGLNADAEWAIERWENLDPAKSQWDEDTVVMAVRRHLIALGWPELDFIVVAQTPSAATELITAGHCLSGHYRDLTRRCIRAELDTAGAETADAFNAGVDRVFLHPHFEALVAIGGGWEQFAHGGDLFPALFEVAAGIGARAAELSPELVWVWDQIQVAFEAGLGWYALVDDGLVVLPRPLLTMPAGRLHRIDGPAVQWPDGSGLHFLEGVEFDHDLHHRLVHRTITPRKHCRASLINDYSPWPRRHRRTCSRAWGPRFWIRAPRALVSIAWTASSGSIDPTTASP